MPDPCVLCDAPDPPPLCLTSRTDFDRLRRAGPGDSIASGADRAMARGAPRKAVPVRFDADRLARTAAPQETARPVRETTGDADTLQQCLKDNGCHGVEAVFVTMGLLHCGLAESRRAFFNAPCREGELHFRNDALGLLEEAADSEV